MLSAAEKQQIIAYVKTHNLPNVNAAAKKVVPKDSFYTRFGKRFIDILVSGLVLLITFPINLVIGICTFFDVGRPIFFFQKRPGKDGQPFTIVKFRNMTNAKDENGNLLHMSKRVTKFGSIMRKTSLDELLNFVSIFKGDMSLIGPRPLSTTYLDRYSSRHAMRHAIRPGLECPNLKNKGYSSSWDEQLENDVWYVENCSFLVDCRMIICLVRMVLDMKTRRLHAKKGVGTFLGYDAQGRAFGANDVPQEYIEICQDVG